MRARPLGRTGLTVSEIGFGAWGIGGWTPGQLSYGPTDDECSLAALEAAIGNGVTFFDTSPLYGLGHSERLIGQVLNGRRDQAVIATKAGYVAYDQPADYSPDAIRRSLEASLERLGTDYLDLLQLHGPDVAELRDDPSPLDALRDLVGQGMLKSWGISVRNPQDAAICIVDLGVPVIQVNFNMLDLRALELGLPALCAEHGTGIVVRTPLCFGFLTGAIGRDTVFPPHDHRSRWPAAQLARWVDGAAALMAVADPERSVGFVHNALRFCLSYDFVATIIPGILTPEEAVFNAAASDLPRLSGDVLAAIETTYGTLDLYGDRQ